MWRNKKWVIVAVLAVVAVAGSVGGVALAADDDSELEKHFGALWERVCAIYEDETGEDIDPEALRDAFAQAQSEMRAEALDNRLQRLVDEGKISQDEAAAYKEWLQDRPDMEQFRQQLEEWQQARPGIPPELEEWQESRPDVPFGLDFPGHGRFRGMGGRCGWAGPTTHDN
jgi:hypothetical protein